jgi:RimJ/RimL family protein N-acetyltransferase
VVEGPVSFRGLPERVAVDADVALRRVDEADVPALVAVINANLDHLRPWMPWAQEAVTRDSQLAWVRDSGLQWEAGVDFAYVVVDEQGIAGAAGLHARNGPGVLEIGYWLAADRTGRGLATRAAAALVRVAASAAGADRVEIRCDEANVRSAAVAERLRFRLIGVVHHTPVAAAETHRHMIWSLDAAHWPSAVAAAGL